jgi:hypothetical protein
MASITFEHVWKRFGDVVAVNDLNIGDMVVNMDNMHLFDPQTEKTLDL